MADVLIVPKFFIHQHGAQV